LLAVLLLAVAVFHRPLLSDVHSAGNARLVNGDARALIPPFLSDRDPALFHDDYVTDYVRRAMPVGFDAMYRAASLVGDPRTFAKWMPIGMMVVLLLAIGAAARRLGGNAAALCAMAIVLGNTLFAGRMIGGLPRAFAFPLVALAALALLQARPVLLAGAVLIGAAMYPILGVIAGLALGVWMLLMPRSMRGLEPRWTLPRRLVLVTGTGLLAIGLVLPGVVRLQPYGPVIRMSDVKHFPENGVNGRLSRNERWPFPKLPRVAPQVARQTVGLPASGPTLREDDGSTPAHRLLTIWKWTLLALTPLAALALLLVPREPGQRRSALRLGIIALVALLAYPVARVVAPYFYLPYRYVLYPLPVLMAIVLPAGLIVLLRPALKRLTGARLARVVAGLLVLAMIGPVAVSMIETNPGDRGFTTRIPAGDRLYAFLARLPKDSLIAGWPAGAIDNVPYFAERPVLVSIESHVAFHEQYALEMRRRCEAIFDAYFATDPAPLKRLRDEFGVTHLIVNRSYFRDRKPVYFEPFTGGIERRIAALGAREPEVLRQAAAAGVFEQGDILVLDLRRIR
jgi:hypothetical protein